MNNAKRIDNSKSIFISPNGLLLDKGIRRVTPVQDAETGYLAFRVTSDSSPSQYEKRYVHVENFRHHSGVPNLPKLKPEDVVFIDGDKRNIDIRNLQLSEEASERLFTNTVNQAPAVKKTGQDRPDDIPPVPAFVSEDTDSIPTETDTAENNNSEKDDTGNNNPDDIRFKAVHKGGGLYNILNEEGDDVTDAFVEPGKKLRGKKNVEKLADENDIIIEF